MTITRIFQDTYSVLNVNFHMENIQNNLVKGRISQAKRLVSNMMTQSNVIMVNGYSFYDKKMYFFYINLSVQYDRSHQYFLDGSPTVQKNFLQSVKALIRLCRHTN